jgi:hypothetical protein
MPAPELPVNINHPIKIVRMARFRTKLFVGIMVLVVTLTSVGLFLAQQKVLSEAKLDMQNDFEREVTDLRHVQEVRNAALAELCTNLVMRPRIHAALEDDALDILYLTARDEMPEVMDRMNLAPFCRHPFCRRNSIGSSMVKAG